MTQLTNNEKIVEAFLKALETRESFDELEKFYHPDIEHTEYPNAIRKSTGVGKLSNLKAASERGKKALLKEEYEIKNIFSVNNTVIVEAIWKGTLAVPIGTIKAGEVMTAHFAQFFEFKDEKIYRQRNYDCFDPF